MNNHQWEAFKLTDFFQLEKGNQNNMASLSKGTVPLVSARNCDNGYKQFVEPNDKRMYNGNIITLNNDGDGGAGIAYYQPHRMALDSHVTALVPKLELNKYHLLFVSRCITKQRDRFGHGYSLNASRLNTFKFMLPVIVEGQPDWQFMESYMNKKELQLLKPAIVEFSKRQICDHQRKTDHLGHKWESFIIGDLFDAKRPSARKEDDYLEGDLFFVASGNINNGVSKYCQPQNGEILDQGNCLTVSPVDGSCYYQPVDFLGRGGAGSSIIILYPKSFKLNRFIGLFVSKAITHAIASKYSYGRMASLERIKKDVIQLPVLAEEAPDWQFMEQYMKEQEVAVLNKAIETKS